jgi:hypothetical protein
LLTVSGIDSEDWVRKHVATELPLDELPTSHESLQALLNQEVPIPVLQSKYDSLVTDHPSLERRLVVGHGELAILFSALLTTFERLQAGRQQHSHCW